MHNLSPNLSLPFLLPNQAQKHITLNDALSLLDALAQLVVINDGLTVPPSAPAEGDCHVVGAQAIGFWADKDAQIASWRNSGWAFLTPQIGWRAYCVSQQDIIVYTQSGWTATSDISSVTNEFDALNVGPGAAADTSNRFHLKSNSSLFDNVTGSHQLKVNKDESSKTASIVFQTDHVGHAEIGLVQDDRLAFKSSVDGQTWQTVAHIDPTDQMLNVTSGIRFNNSPTALSHYEEGVWTPSFIASASAGTPTYTVNSGHFVRIGRLVTVTGRIIWSDLGTLSGHVSLAGLPFTCASGTEYRAQMLAPWYNGLAMKSDVSVLGGFTEPGQSHIRLWGASNASEGINLMLQTSHLSAEGEIYFNCNYMTEN